MVRETIGHWHHNYVKYYRTDIKSHIICQFSSCWFRKGLKFLFCKIYPTPRMDVTSLRFSCEAGLKLERFFNSMENGKMYARVKGPGTNACIHYRDALWRHVHSQSGIKIRCKQIFANIVGFFTDFISAVAIQTKIIHIRLSNVLGKECSNINIFSFVPFTTWIKKDHIKSEHNIQRNFHTGIAVSRSIQCRALCVPFDFQSILVCSSRNRRKEKIEPVELVCMVKHLRCSTSEEGSCERYIGLHIIIKIMVKVSHVLLFIFWFRLVPTFNRQNLSLLEDNQ